MSLNARPLLLCGVLLISIAIASRVQYKSFPRAFAEPFHSPPSHVPLRAALPESLAKKEAYPVRRANIPDFLLTSRSAYAVTDNGTELFAKDEHTAFPIASITKLMTALVALDRLPLTSPVPITRDAIRTEGDSAHFAAGEILTLHDALLALLVPSSNDAAVAIADAAGGNDSFVSAMNEKATVLGMRETHFANVHGLAPPGNTASAKDIAILLQAVLRQPLLREVIRQAHVDIVSVNGKQHSFDNTDLLLSRLPGAFGGKTGYTAESQGTLAFAFGPLAALAHGDPQPGDPLVLTVVLGSDDRFTDTEALARWIIAAYVWN